MAEFSILGKDPEGNDKTYKGTAEDVVFVSQSHDSHVKLTGVVLNDEPEYKYRFWVRQKGQAHHCKVTADEYKFQTNDGGTAWVHFYKDNFRRASFPQDTIQYIWQIREEK